MDTRTQITITHGDNSQCPAVQSGAWKWCRGHTSHSVKVMKYAYSLHTNRDASPAIGRLIHTIGATRFEDDFTDEELRTYREGLAAIGVHVVEIESWAETPHQSVL